MKSNTRNIALIVVGVVALVGLASFLIYKNKKKKPKKILLLGGLDYRSGDLKIDEQVALLEKGSNIVVEGFRHNNSKAIISAIKQSKNSIYVVLFSKGGEYSNEIAKTMKSKDLPLSYLYIVQPYAKSSKTSQSIKNAVALGVPNANVIVGSSSSTGKGVVSNTTKTPTCSPNHWCALEMVGNIIVKSKN
jgi:LPXTG-motif cell wall-anchored protein